MFGTFAKNWRSYIPKNASIAAAMATRTGRSYARWAAFGAGMGAIRGLADNIVGEDRVSVMGGMMQGAMMGAGFRGIGSLWRAGSKARGAASVARRSAPKPMLLSDMRGRPIPGAGFTMSGTRP